MSRGILSILLVSLLASVGLFGQAVIDNGEIRVALESYGEIEVFSPATATDTIFQIDRMSLLTGVSVDAVFDYFEDADNVSAPEVVLQPMLSDFELRGTFDNFFSQEPPAVVEKVNIYGWNSGAFVVMKIVVRNAETTAIDAIHGFEVLPQVDGAYGDETVEYLPAEGVVAMYKAGATHTGYKIFSHAISSINTFEWFSGFGGSDTLLYNYLSYGAIDTSYTAGVDGAVNVPALPVMTMAPDDSVTIWMGIAIGADMNTMLANINAAETAYSGLTAIRPVAGALPGSFRLEQNYPNPFNPSTTIAFSLPRSETVELVVYNLLGEAVVTLVDETLEAGAYEYDFRAGNLPSGVYFYSLKAGEFNQTRRMMLLK